MDFTPEDDDDFIPEMPEGYGAEFIDADNHKNVDDMTEEELSEHDVYPNMLSRS